MNPLKFAPAAYQAAAHISPHQVGAISEGAGRLLQGRVDKVFPPSSMEHLRQMHLNSQNNNPGADRMLEYISHGSRASGAPFFGGRDSEDVMPNVRKLMIGSSNQITDLAGEQNAKQHYRSFKAGPASALVHQLWGKATPEQRKDLSTFSYSHFPGQTAQQVAQGQAPTKEWKGKDFNYNLQDSSAKRFVDYRKDDPSWSKLFNQVDAEQHKNSKGYGMLYPAMSAARKVGDFTAGKMVQKGVELQERDPIMEKKSADAPKPATRTELLELGKCCGSGCKNCPYDPKHVTGTTKVKPRKKDAEVGLPESWKDQEKEKEATDAQSSYLTHLNSPKYFGREGSVVTAEMLLDAARKHGVDPRLLASVVANESAWGTARNAREANNFSGMMTNSGAGTELQKFENPEAGLDEAASLLKRRYIDKGLDTVEKIAPVYAPTAGATNDPTGVNKHWAGTVSSIMKRIPEPQPIQPAAPQPVMAVNTAPTQQQPPRVQTYLDNGKTNVLPLPTNTMEGVVSDPPQGESPALGDSWSVAQNEKRSGYIPQEMLLRQAKRRGECADCGAPNTPENNKCECPSKEAKISDEKALELHRAREATNTEPTEAQSEAGNYAKGKIKLRGFDISIENPIGSARTGVDPDGKPWRSIMHRDYGYFLGTEANDGDHVDVYIGEDPENDPIWIVNQTKFGSDEFDEPKVILGAPDEKAARELYEKNYPLDWDGIGSIHKVTVVQLKAWLDAKPSGEYKPSMKKASELATAALYKSALWDKVLPPVLGGGLAGGIGAGLGYLGGGPEAALTFGTLGAAVGGTTAHLLNRAGDTDALERQRAEIIQRIGNGEIPSEQDVNNLEYIDYVLSKKASAHANAAILKHGLEKQAFWGALRQGATMAGKYGRQGAQYGSKAFNQKNLAIGGGALGLGGAYQHWTNPDMSLGQKGLATFGDTAKGVADWTPLGMPEGWDAIDTMIRDWDYSGYGPRDSELAQGLNYDGVKEFDAGTWQHAVTLGNLPQKMLNAASRASMKTLGGTRLGKWMYGDTAGDPRFAGKNYQDILDEAAKPMEGFAERQQQERDRMHAQQNSGGNIAWDGKGTQNNTYTAQRLADRNRKAEDINNKPKSRWDFG